jgi:hypothetical protein
MPEITITGWRTRDVRFPTSLDKTGSDAMNAAGDYSSAYCILETDSELTGHGMVSCPKPNGQSQNTARLTIQLRHSPSAVVTT